MFESLKHWFATLEQKSHLFEHEDDALLHSALAAVLYHLIAADGQVDQRERRAFDDLLRSQFDLDADQLSHLFEAASGSSGDLRGDLHTINFYLKDNPGVRMRFLQQLLPLIEVQGTRQAELDLFYEILHEVFPEIRDPA